MRNSRLRIVFLSSIFVLCLSHLHASPGNGEGNHPVRLKSSGDALSGAFYENRGQIRSGGGEHSPIEYYALYNNTRVYFTSSGWQIVQSASPQNASVISEATGRQMLEQGATPALRNKDADFLQQQENVSSVSFVGCSSDVKFEVAEQLPRRLHYYLPDVPQGITDIPGYQTLRYRNVYDNIDLVLHASESGMKYEFEVRPGGHVSDIQIRYDGYDCSVEMPDGAVQFFGHDQCLQEGRPFTFQETEQGIIEVGSSYKLEQSLLSFNVDTYDEGRVLVIDPWSTFYGGNNEDYFYSIECDSKNAIVVAGKSASIDFPVHSAMQSSLGGGSDAVVVKFDSTGACKWATFIGGSGNEFLYDLAIDLNRSIFICGYSTSPDFPIYNSWQNTTPYANGFIVKLDSSGLRRWATLFGGDSGVAVIAGIDTDNQGNIYATGSTEAPDYPTLNAYQTQLTGVESAFYLKATSTGTLLFSSYFGGSGRDEAWDIAAMPAGGFVLCGTTTSQNLPTLNAQQGALGGSTDGFITRFNQLGQPVWSTYHGGSASDIALNVLIDRDTNLIIQGFTSSTNFPVQRAAQNDLGGDYDDFISKFTAQGTLIWSTYFGGSGKELENAGGHRLGSQIAVHSSGKIGLAGSTQSADFPMLNANYPVCPDTGRSAQVQEAFVAQFDSSGTLEWSTWLGGDDDDVAYGMAYDLRGNAYVSGSTKSANFPIFDPLQDSIGGVRNPPLTGRYSFDAFLTRIRLDGYIPMILSQLSAERVPEGVEVNWRTELEVNAFGFMVERQYGSNGGWQDIGFEPAQGANRGRHDYRFMDQSCDISEKRILYRLRMIDVDGTVEYSPAVEVNSAGAASALTFNILYPSPAESWITLGFILPEGSTVDLYVNDISGRERRMILEKEQLSSGSHGVTLSTAGWSAGLHLITLQNGTDRIVRKVVVVK